VSKIEMLSKLTDLRKSYSTYYRPGPGKKYSNMSSWWARHEPHECPSCHSRLRNSYPFSVRTSTNEVEASCITVS